MSSDIANDTQSAAPSSPPEEIVACAGRYYRNARFIIVLALLGFGVAFLYDGFVRYPKANDAHLAAGKPVDRLPHTELDLILQRALGMVLPPLAMALLAWTLYNSRGAYRLCGDTLHIPGHPPIALSSIRRIDKQLWSKKGIATLEYEIPGKKSPGQFKLDDFVYQRQPTDQILVAVENYVTAQG